MPLPVLFFIHTVLLSKVRLPEARNPLLICLLSKRLFHYFRRYVPASRLQVSSCHYSHHMIQNPVPSYRMTIQFHSRSDRIFRTAKSLFFHLWSWSSNRTSDRSVIFLSVYRKNVCLSTSGRLLILARSGFSGKWPLYFRVNTSCLIPVSIR